MKKIFYLAAIGLCICVIGWKAMSIIGYFQDYQQSDQVYKQLSEEVSVKQKKPPDFGVESKSGTDQSFDIGQETITVSVDHLKQINPDYVGWLIVPGTRINYPVVQGSDNEYYLNHLFDGTENHAGCLFLDSENTPDFLCRNSVIYGHYMKNKSMFYELSYYKDADWWKEHPYGYLILPDRTEKLMVFSAYVTDVSEEAWKLDFSNQEAYENWIQKCKDKSMVSPQTEVGIPKAVITCSTCSYEFENARFVVHLAICSD